MKQTPLTATRAAITQACVAASNGAISPNADELTQMTRLVDQAPPYVRDQVMRALVEDLISQRTRPQRGRRLPNAPRS